MIKKIFDSLYITKRTVKKAITQFRFLTDSEKLMAPQKINKLNIKNKKILIISPHPDDEVFGCGGTIKQISKQNEISCIYITSGGPTILKNTYANMKIVEQEALNASKILGIKNNLFLRATNAQVTFDKNNKKLLKKLEKEISKINPDIIFLPTPLENHLDHTATTKLVLTAYKKSFETFFYAVHTPINLPTTLVDITKQMPIIKKAINAYKQTLNNDPMIRANITLHNYYGIIGFGKGWAEPFIVMNSKNARKLIE